jgi:hypothetical protein
MYYSAYCLYDGTVIGVYPIRKPMPRLIKQRKIHVDEDGACNEWFWNGKELADVKNDLRTRGQDLIAMRLNTRRAIREITQPWFIQLQSNIEQLRNQLDQITRLLANKPIE